MPRSITDIDPRDRRVLMRVDFNVPLDASGAISDDRRIRMSLPTIRSVVDRGGKLVLISHLGRPEGKGFEADGTLKPAADRLRELLGGAKVAFPGNDCVDASAAAAVAAMKPGEIVVLENLRFHKGEKKGDAGFAAKLAAFGDIYCNDAFGTAHRNDASMYAVPMAMMERPRVAGLLLEKEIRYLSEAIRKPKHPFVAILGGAKVSDKLPALRNLIGKVDAILVGGAMAYTFLAAREVEIGASRVERDLVGEAKAILDLAAASRTTIELPGDHVCGRALEPGTPTQTSSPGIPAGWMGLDIGPVAADRYAKIISSAATIVWNGPVGAFETPPFDAGSRKLAAACAKSTAGGATSIVGGGDTAAAVEQFGFADAMSHVSTGGGASLEMLEGRDFDSLKVLQ